MKRMHRLLLRSCCLLLLTAIAAEHAGAIPEAKLTIKVVDDEGKPLSGIPVHAWLSESAIRDGQTDTNGIVVAEGACSIKDIPISIVKEGYYDSRLTYSYPNYVSIKDNKWQPWNPTVTAIVRRIISPVAMYAKRIETTIPATNTLYGFDLMAADWVQPAGRGNVSDLVFRIDGRWINYRDNDSTLTLTFSQPNDGFIQVGHDVVDRRPSGSVFRLPRYAPESGYTSAIKWCYARKQITGSGQDRIIDEVNVEGRDYLFRVRSQTNATGVVTNALYGKVHGNIRFVGADGNARGSWLAFTYYLNPTPNDRNLEFDPKKNLFKDLKSTEQVTDP